MDTLQQQSFPITEARVITRASRPSEKTSPKSLLILAVATMGGLVLGVGLGILREISDRVFRTSSQVEAQLKTDCLAIIPAIKSGKLHPWALKRLQRCRLENYCANAGGFDTYLIRRFRVLPSRYAL